MLWFGKKSINFSFFGKPNGTKNILRPKSKYLLIIVQMSTNLFLTRVINATHVGTYTYIIHKSSGKLRERGGRPAPSRAGVTHMTILLKKALFIVSTKRTVAKSQNLSPWFVYGPLAIGNMTSNRTIFESLPNIHVD